MENVEQKKESKKTLEDENSNFIRKLFWGAIGVFIGVTLLFFYINNWAFPTVNVTSNNDSSNTLSNLGTIGDYFGGLINPLLGFVSFCALLYTIHIQREELRFTREELARSAKAQEENSKIFKQQQFESTFFSLLNKIISIIDDFHSSHLIKDNLSTKNLAMEYFSQSQTLEDAWKRIDLFDKKLPQIFMLIYQLLKLIDKYEIDISSETGKEHSFKIAKTYSNILRSCLDRDLLQLFAINGCRTDLNNIQIYKKYIERYSLLEHISFRFHHTEENPFYLKDMTVIYYSEAFGENKDYREIKRTIDIRKIDVINGSREKNIRELRDAFEEKYEDHAN